MATYNLWITSKAIRNRTDLPTDLVNSHRRFDPSTPSKSIKVITSFLHNAHGNSLYVGGLGNCMMNYSYVKVVIEIPAQSKSAPEKEDLLRRTLETCIDYVKYPETTEIEVRIQEVQPEDCVSIRPGGR